MKKLIALNYLYLSKNHAGGKDQVGLNLLKGFYENKLIDNMIVICYRYSTEIIQTIAPGIQMIILKNGKQRNELTRLLELCYNNTFKIPRIIKKYDIGLIYHLSCNNGLRKLPTKSIVIPHDIKAVAHRVLANVKVPFYKYLMYRAQYYIDFKHADYIIAISDTDKNEIKKYYPKFKDKVKRIYNPIDINPLKIEDKQFVTKKYICAINLQFHHKNIITLIKAFDLIKDQVDCELLLIGNVPERVKYLKEYVQQNNLESRIKFLGFVKDEELRNILIGSSLYVNPTLYEGFGMTAVEAMILRVPTLISKIPTNYEITEGLCEYYYPAEDEKALARKLLECLNKTYEQDKLEKISAQIYNSYNYRYISKEYFDFFKQI